MSKEKERAKFLMILFFGLFFISFFSFLSLLIINIVIFLNPIECFEAFFAFFNVFWGFGGCLVSFIFAFFGTRYENKYIGKEDYDVAVHKIRKDLVIMLCGFLVVTGTGIGIYSASHIAAYREKRFYTRERWLSGNEERRGEIVSSFLLQYNLRSFDVEEVDYYLGTPDLVSSGDYIYNLGFGMACAHGDPSTLEIEFSLSSEVVDYHIGDA